MVRCGAILVALALGAAGTADARDEVPAARVEAAFTPGDDIAGLIAGHIGRARASVRMQAYLFTDRRIAAALVAARRRGVEVEVIGDATQQANGGLPHLGTLERAGARIFLDKAHAASHDKVVIVDAGEARATVITGSYNFTAAAQSRNAENVVVISGNRRVTDRFAENFARHRLHATPWP